MANSDRIYRVTAIVHDAFLKVVRSGLNETRAADHVAQLRTGHRGMPNDALAQVLISRAVRKTTVEGAANGAAISGCELAIGAPVPEPGHKVAAGLAIGALIGGDVTYTTAVQMQLVMDMAQLYECPFSKEDEDDVWLIFKAAMGLKGTERIGFYSRILVYEAAKKQFRRFLRTGLRKAVQLGVGKVAGPRIAKYLAEKYVIRLVFGINIVLGGLFNYWVTKAVGKWAKVKAKIRSSVFSQADLLRNDPKWRIWVLPIMFHVGTADDKLTDNLVTVYAHAQQRLGLSEAELQTVESLVNSESLWTQMEKELPQLRDGKFERCLFDIAVTAAAVNMAPSPEQHECLTHLGRLLNIDYLPGDLEKKMAFFKT